jgi:streptogramin lyase
MLERFRIDREYEGTGAYDVLVTEDGSVWFTSYPGGTLGRIGPDGDAAVFQPAGDPSATLSLAADDTGSIWVSDPRRSALVQVHPDGGLDQYAVPPVDERTSLPRDLTSAPDGRIWFTDPGTGTIRSLDPARPAGVRNVKAGRPDDELRSIAAAPGGVIWATFAERPALAKVEDREVTVLPVPVRGGLNDVAVADDGTIWITTPTEEVLHLSADGTEVLARYRLPAGATYADDLAIAADGSVWAAATDAAVIVRFDPAE